MFFRRGDVITLLSEEMGRQCHLLKIYVKLNYQMIMRGLLSRLKVSWYVGVRKTDGSAIYRELFQVGNSSYLHFSVIQQ